jgi:hypothetical protein
MRCGRTTVATAAECWCPQVAVADMALVSSLFSFTTGLDNSFDKNINCAQAVGLANLGFWDANDCRRLIVSEARTKCCVTPPVPPPVAPPVAPPVTPPLAMSGKMMMMGMPMGM